MLQILKDFYFLINYISSSLICFNRFQRGWEHDSENGDSSSLTFHRCQLSGNNWTPSIDFLAISASKTSIPATKTTIVSQHNNLNSKLGVFMAKFTRASINSSLQKKVASRVIPYPPLAPLSVPIEVERKFVGPEMLRGLDEFI